MRQLEADPRIKSTITRPLNADKIVDALFPIVVAKGTKSACNYYEVLLRENQQPAEMTETKPLRLLWHGYPMWFLGKKIHGLFRR